MTNWKDTVQAIAPSLGRSLDGPLGNIGRRLLAEALFERAATDAEIATAIAEGGSEMVDRLRGAEGRFLATIKRAGVDLESSVDGGRRSDHFRWVSPAIATLVVGGFLLMVGYLIVCPTGLSNVEGNTLGIVGTLIGYVSAKADQIVSYYFGSSHGSAVKTDILERAAQRSDGGASPAPTPSGPSPTPSPSPDPTTAAHLVAGTGAVDNPDTA